MEASQIQHGEPRRLVMSAPTPLRQDFDAPQVRGLAMKTKDGPQARRLLALAAIYDGATRTEAAKIGGVGLQIIRDWVLRFNARGPISRPRLAASICGDEIADQEWTIDADERLVHASCELIESRNG
jgi:hypothetical protein